MDVKDLKKHLLNNKGDIIKILKHFDFHSMHDVTNGIMFGKPDGDSDKSCSIKFDENLTASSFSIGYSGDLFGMIAETHEMEWYDVLYTSELIINKKIEHDETIDIFDGILDTKKDSNNIKYLTYDDSILSDYEKIWNEKFALDNINPRTQMLFEVGYCNEENRISIPWRDYDGQIVGIVGRANYDTDLRYFPIIPFQKKYHLYGLYQNKEEIRKTGIAYIFESEKSIMQCNSYGVKNTVALGCSTISEYQVELLIKSGCRCFILCHDEGSEQKVIKRNIQMIKDCLFMMDAKIGLLIDRKNEIMPKDSKCSPSDLGKTKLLQLIENNIRMSN